MYKLSIRERVAVRQFADRVNKMAAQLMAETGKTEGAHYRAIKHHLSRIGYEITEGEIQDMGPPDAVVVGQEEMLWEKEKGCPEQKAPIQP